MRKCPECPKGQMLLGVKEHHTLVGKQLLRTWVCEACSYHEIDARKTTRAY